MYEAFHASVSVSDGSEWFTLQSVERGYVAWGYVEHSLSVNRKAEHLGVNCFSTEQTWVTVGEFGLRAKGISKENKWLYWLDCLKSYWINNKKPHYKSTDEKYINSIWKYIQIQAWLNILEQYICVKWGRAEIYK
jgi:hypothetical protein